MGRLPHANGWHAAGLTDEHRPRRAWPTLAATGHDIPHALEGIILRRRIASPDKTRRVDDHLVNQQIRPPVVDHFPAPGQILVGSPRLHHLLVFPNRQGIEAGNQFFISMGCFEVLVAFDRIDGWLAVAGTGGTAARRGQRRGDR